MLRQRRPGQAVSEYLVFIVLMITAMVLMRDYILRGFAGRWKSVGDSIGYGRLYDVNKTTECAYYDDGSFNMWYSQRQFLLHNCDTACYSSLLNGERCHDCVCGSQDTRCGDPVTCS